MNENQGRQGGGGWGRLYLKWLKTLGLICSIYTYYEIMDYKTIYKRLLIQSTYISDNLFSPSKSWDDLRMDISVCFSVMGRVERRVGTEVKLNLMLAMPFSLISFSVLICKLKIISTSKDFWENEMNEWMGNCLAQVVIQEKKLNGFFQMRMVKKYIYNKKYKKEVKSG